MNAATVPAPIQASALDIACRVALIVANLIAVVARVSLRDHRAITALTIPVARRLNRASRAFGRLMARLATGLPYRLRAPRPQQDGKPAPARPAQANPWDGLRIPRRHGWLVALLGHEAAAGRRQLEHLLAQPDVVALFDACPEAKRRLLPIGRLLGLDAFAPPPRLRTPRPPKPPQPAPEPIRIGPPPSPLTPGHPCAEHRPSAKWPSALPRAARRRLARQPG